MRVRLPDGPPATEGLAGLRWRGIAFDHFDGRAWRARLPRQVTLPRPAAGQFEVTPYRGVGPVLTQEIYLEPIGSEIIFVAPRLLAVGLAADAMKLDDMGSVSVPLPSARLRYVAYSELEPARPRVVAGAAAPARLDSDALDRYLQLPPLTARVADLARAASAGSRSPYDAATRLTSFLSREYRYTLALSRQTQLGPLEEFLFVRRSGNCEYFATALAVMLRSVGIPARLVNGFQRGEWNPYGRYFMVRERDAHSWVEAFIDGVGWATFDPSPRGEANAEARPGAVGFYLDALRLRWYRHVVNWSLRDQVSMAAAFQRGATAWRERLSDGRSWSGLPRVARVWGVAAAAGMAAFALWRRRSRRSGGAPSPRLPWFYERALRALARRDLRPEPGETAREFLARVAARAPRCGAPLCRLTAGYELIRFGSVGPSLEETRELRARLAELERGRSAPPRVMSDAPLPRGLR